MASRRLTPLEEAEARLVFADSILYHRVRVNERSRWTNALPRLQAWLTGRAAQAGDNAVTLGHAVHFPRALRTSAASMATGDLGDFAWLVHELTHVWQAERIGPRYAWQAIRMHLKRGEEVYGYGGDVQVVVAAKSGRHLRDFHVEQQAEIARDYYIRRKLDFDTHEWEPLMAEFRGR